MSEQPQGYPVTSAGSYICPDCGQWVGPDAYHVCPSDEDSELMVFYTGQSMTPFEAQVLAILERIATALEDIRAALS